MEKYPIQFKLGDTEHFISRAEAKELVSILSNQILESEKEDLQDFDTKVCDECDECFFFDNAEGRCSCDNQYLLKECYEEDLIYLKKE